MNCSRGRGSAAHVVGASRGVPQPVGWPPAIGWLAMGWAQPTGWPQPMEWRQPGPYPQPLGSAQAMCGGSHLMDRAHVGLACGVVRCPATPPFPPPSRAALAPRIAQPPARPSVSRLWAARALVGHMRDRVDVVHAEGRRKEPTHRLKESVAPVPSWGSTYKHNYLKSATTVVVLNSDLLVRHVPPATITQTTNGIALVSHTIPVDAFVAIVAFTTGTFGTSPLHVRCPRPSCVADRPLPVPAKPLWVRGFRTTSSTCGVATGAAHVGGAGGRRSGSAHRGVGGRWSAQGVAAGSRRASAQGVGAGCRRRSAQSVGGSPLGAGAADWGRGPVVGELRRKGRERAGNGLSGPDGLNRWGMP